MGQGSGVESLRSKVQGPDFGPWTKEWQGSVVLRHVSASILFCDGRFRDGWTGRPRLRLVGVEGFAPTSSEEHRFYRQAQLSHSGAHLWKLVAGTGIEPVVKDV